MKNITKTIILFWATLIMGLALGADHMVDPSYKQVALIPGGENGQFKLLYLNQGRTRVSVTIYDENGVLIWKRTMVANPSFMLPIDLQQKKAGKYQVRIGDKYGTVSKMAFVSSLPNTTVIPGKEPNRYKMVVQNGKENQRIKVEIYDDGGNLQFSEALTFNVGISKEYDLAQWKGRPVSFHLCDGDNICDWYYF